MTKGTGETRNIRTTYPAMNPCPNCGGKMLKKTDHDGYYYGNKFTCESCGLSWRNKHQMDCWYHPNYDGGESRDRGDRQRITLEDVEAWNRFAHPIRECPICKQNNVKLDFDKYKSVTGTLTCPDCKICFGVGYKDRDELITRFNNRK